MSETILEVRDLTVSFGDRIAVDKLSLQVGRGEVLGLVGESGSGKSVTGLAILGLVDAPGCSVSGSVRLEGEELVGQPDRRLRTLRGRRLAMIFQDPMTTLNPVLRVDTQMIEAITAHERISARAARERARDALVRVGIPSPDERLKAYPHQFSGGMRQRVAIAIALLHRPALLVADEPTTALDVTIQAQIISQVQELAAESGTAMIWISHDLSVIAGLADKVAVMYAGRIVEEGPVKEVLEAPIHPYPAGLIGSVPSRNKRGSPLAQIPGIAPALGNLPAGCAFQPRCPRATDLCARARPDATAYPGGRAARCHHPMLANEAAA